MLSLSGGPLQVPHADACCAFDIVGVTSYGSLVCGSGAPGVYTKVSKYLDWIESIVWPRVSVVHNRYDTLIFPD